MNRHIDSCALDTLAALNRPGKTDMLSHVVAVFKTHSPALINDMQDGLDQGDTLAVCTAAHSLKSSSAYVGASLLAQRCVEIEAAARDDNLPACMALGEAVTALFEASVIELDQIMEKAA